MTKLFCHCERSVAIAQSSNRTDNAITTQTSFARNDQRRAFTLAEVLITLAIIGVVAAMTIPTLIANYQEKATVAKLKKTYSILNQAYALARVDYGTVDQWGMVNPAVDEEGNYTPEFSNNFPLFWNIMTKYMREVSRCEPSYESCDNIFVKNFENYTLDGTLRGTNTRGVDMAVLLQDGILLSGGYIYDSTCSTNYGSGNMLSHVCGDFSVKLGVKEDKYIAGKNTFYFYITKNGIYPVGTNDDTEISFGNACGRVNSSYSRNGYGCTAWILENGNMDYLHCDDLSWSGKHKCTD